jgi:uncharacterized protein (TIGR02680 family)
MPDTPSDRWYPHRAGIGNVWEYDDQVFHFSDGRLILRGPNGSGKSNALALLFPFLLDAHMSAARMDPFAGGRSMKSLLLCAQKEGEGAGWYRHEHRTGYVWLEFRRPGSTENGAGERFLVIGVGARASTARDAEAWYFVTEARPGFDLDLAPEGVCLSRQQLAEILGPEAVFLTAEAYRVEVDRCLFGLGADRYRNLVTLLLVLRRPHLAGKLDLDELSNILSDGLPTLDTSLVADVAASFEDLEAVAEDLRRLREAKRVVDGFLPAYRRYLATMARARADDVLDAQRRLRAAHGRLAEADAACVAAEAESQAGQAELAANREERKVTANRQRAVLESPAYREAKDLAELTQRAADAEEGEEAAGRRLAQALAAEVAAEQALVAAREKLEASERFAGKAFRDVATAADDAGVAWTLRLEDLEQDGWEPGLRAAAALRRDDLAAVTDALDGAERAATEARLAAVAASRAVEAADAADAARRTRSGAVESARAELAGAVSTWAEQRPDGVLGEGDTAALVEAVGSFGEPDAPSPLDVLRTRLLPRQEALAAAAARNANEAEVVRGAHEAAHEERRRVAAEPVPSPARLPTRPADRSGRPGAPFFACCDFSPSLGAAERAGLEAALDAAGILDAWIDPPGGERAGRPGDHDAGPALDAWIQADPQDGVPTLADVLVPDPPPGSGLSATDVAAVLASVALASAGVAVAVDGSFWLGPLAGRFAKDAAEFVGAGAREERRRRLLAELDATIAALEMKLGELEDERARLARRQSELAEATKTLPLPGTLAVTMAALAEAVGAARSAREAAVRAENDAARAAGAAQEAADRLASLAAERNVPARREDVRALAEAVRVYERRAESLVGARDRRRGDIAGVEREHQQREGRAREAEDRRSEHGDAAIHARALAARVSELRARLGPDADSPVLLLAELEAALATLEQAERAGHEKAREVAARLGAARATREGASSEAARFASERERAARRIEVLRRRDVLAGVLVPPSGTDTAGGADYGDAPSDGAADVPAESGDLARLVARASAGAPTGPDARDEARKGLDVAYKSLLDDLRRGYDPAMEPVDELEIVSVTSEAGTFSVFRLAAQLAEQVASQEELLSERDRMIFERHLLSRVADALRGLLNEADEFLDEANACLAETPTASGLRVRLRWEPGTSDPALGGALSLLRRTPELLGPDDRERLRRFFAGAIAAARADQPGEPYGVVLTRVFDYRSWHRFAPHLLTASGGNQRLTRTVFRNLSGGEQATALHLPLFAAAAAHYRVAQRGAPRLVALDEAFAGIDETMRGELMGLLVRFGLDVVMTGHELWGDYAEVPSVMVYDLLRRPPAEGVSVLAFRWDGAGLTAAGSAAATA